MFWGIRKPFSSIRLACCKSFIRVLRFSFFFASFAVHAQVPAPSCASPTALNAASAFSDGGFAYLIPGSFGAADNSGSPTQSTLRVFENGREIAPAHARHADIRAVGRGRFSHWGTNGAGSIRISASDNTDVRRNGKRYSYCMGAATSASPAPAPAPVATASAPAPALPSPTLKAYFVAPGGSDSAAGTKAAPFATLQKAHDVAVAGDTIYMRGGTYAISKQITLTRDGASGKHIKVFAYPGEVPVIDASKHSSAGSYPIRFNSGNWWHVKGLEIKNGITGGILITDASHNNIIEACNVHHNGRTTTTSGAGIRVAGTSANNQILNNDSHHNRDPSLGNADGIVLGSTGAGNIARGNRVWRNSDDGLDMWNGGPATVVNNWAWENGYDDNLKPLGNGNGFKLGGNHAGRISGGHTVANNVAWKNKASGLEENNSPETKPSMVYNNTSSNNGRLAFSMGSLLHVMRNNLAYGTVGVANANDAANSWNLAVTVNNADFASMDDTCARGPRKADGSLPDCSFLRLVSGSDLIDKGVNVGLPYSGAAPDLGAGNR